MNDYDTPDITATTPETTQPETATPEAHPPIPPLPAPSAQVPPYGSDWQPQAKSPVLAVFWALGFLGHFYVGAYQRAVVFIISFFLAIHLLPGPVCVFVPIFIWFWNLFDAYRQAQLVNLREEAEGEVPQPSGKGTLMFGVFLIVAGAILLIDRFFPIDLYWLRQWWPALLIGAGVYFIFGAIREQMNRGNETGIE